jgi:hypothetical protein
MRLPELFCKDCQHKETCRPPYCPPVKWLHGAARREPLSSDILGDYPVEENYNTILAERIEDRRERAERIQEIPNFKKRAVAAMLHVGLRKTQIAALLKVTRQQIYNIIR